MKYLEIDTLSNIKSSYRAVVDCFLISKKSFIKDILSSKWYDIVLRFLKGASEVANEIISKSNVLLRCSNGFDQSAVISALSQIILNPYYRTYSGFLVLV